MKRICKTVREPQALAEYKQKFQLAPSEQTWSKFKKQAERRNSVKNELRRDQRGLCCYCENTLISADESVEHFIPRSADHSLELNWSNLLLSCKGGERSLPDDIADGIYRYEPGASKTCGHAKLAATAAILNPLTLPSSPRLFRVRSESGEIVADEAKCDEAGIDPKLVAETIEKLGLKASRLNRARLAILESLNDLLCEDAADRPCSTDREFRLATEQISPTGPLPAFFTTIRFFLGSGCESYLQSIQFQG
jgi:uncharacterized protein (TIGR02646 family)